MKVVIFGATGKTGQHVVKQALDAGHTVTAFVRTPSKLAVQNHANLRIAQGDILDAEKVAQAVAGVDVVVSVLGPTSGGEPLQISRGTQNIIKAMQRHGVERLVLSAGAGVGDPKDSPKLINRVVELLLKTFSRRAYEDMMDTVRIVRGSSLDWTVVRVPMLTDDAASGSVKVAYVGKGMGMRITRADMAHFMLDQLDNRQYVRQAPAISN